jgi:DNA-binding PadR family transcriptional regulator
VTKAQEASEETSEEEPEEQLSDLEVALLGLLSVRSMTGYEINRHYARALAPWWETPRTQVYPKLRELKSRGLVEEEHVVQDGKPNKRVYSVGATGRTALTSWLAGPIRRTDMKHHMMMRLFLGNLLPVETMRRLLEDYRTEMAERAQALRDARAKFSRSLSGPYRTKVFYELLSLDHLIALADLEVSGTQKALEAIELDPGIRPTDGGEHLGQLLDMYREQAM